MVYDLSISYSLPVQGQVIMQIYTLKSEEVTALVQNEIQEAGEYGLTFDATNLNSGVYLYHLKTGSTGI